MKKRIWYMDVIWGVCSTNIAVDHIVSFPAFSRVFLYRVYTLPMGHDGAVDVHVSYVLVTWFETRQPQMEERLCHGHVQTYRSLIHVPRWQCLHLLIYVHFQRFHRYITAVTYKLNIRRYSLNWTLFVEHATSLWNRSV